MMSKQLDVAESHHFHWYLNVIGKEPLHVPVVALMNAVSSDEKEDPGEGRDELPKQESQMYFGRFVNEQVEDLERQLRELGVPDKDIHEMIRKNPFRHVEHAIRDLIDEHANNQTTGQQEPDLAGAESLPG
jgi:hypothetical protein